MEKINDKAIMEMNIALNNLKREWIDTFKLQELQDKFKELGFIHYSLMPTELVRLNQIDKVSSGIYRFNGLPTHIHIMEKALKRCQERVKSWGKKNIRVDEEVPVANCEPITEEYCVNYLKKLGYKVMKPKPVEYEEL